MKAKGTAMARKPNLIGQRRSWSLSCRRVSGEMGIRGIFAAEEVSDEGK